MKRGSEADRSECLVNVLLNRHIRSEVLYHFIETNLLL